MRTLQPCLLSLLTLVSLRAAAADPAPFAPNFAWQQSLPIVSESKGIAPIGGTELRALAAFNGKLFASNSYWMDTEANNPALPGAQIFRLDRPGGPWVVDEELDPVMPDGRRVYYGIASLVPVTFTLDSDGRALDPPVAMMVAGLWSRNPGLEVLSRGLANQWAQTILPGQDQAPAGSQVRSFATHVDTVTHQQLIFGGSQNAIFTGQYDRDARGIAWNAAPELQGNLTGVSGTKGRVMAMAEANGKLYAAVYGTLYERQDGEAASWLPVFTVNVVPSDNISHESGMRGLTAIASPNGPGQSLLVGIEENPLVVWRIDVASAQDAGGQYPGSLELNVSDYLAQQLGTKVNYGIMAYNNMTVLPDPAGLCPSLLMGLHFDTPELPRNETFGRSHSNGQGMFLLRDCHGNYTAQAISDPNVQPVPKLESVRTMILSPFAGDAPGTIYAGGFDAVNTPTHNSAWLYRGVVDTVAISSLCSDAFPSCRSGASFTRTAGDPITFSAAAADSAGQALSYAWFVSGKSEGQGAASLTLKNEVAGSKQVEVVVTSPTGASASATVTLIVNPDVVTITSLCPDAYPGCPENSTISRQKDVRTVLNVAASDAGGNALSYAWYLNGNAVGNGKPSLTLDNQALGTKLVTVVVTSATGASATAKLTLLVVR